MVLDYFTKAGKLWLQPPWQFLHFLLTLWYLMLDIVEALKSYAVTSGLWMKYRYLNLSNLRHLAIVVESEEARKTSNIITLLHWLKTIGVKNVSLYDMEGVLKKSKDTIMEKTNATLWQEGSEKESIVDSKSLRLEFLSLPDGKEAVVKAANFLLVKNLKNKVDSEQPVFTEPDVAEALKAVGCAGPDPDLLLIFGPVRCHLGFPAWRMRYTEIVHMGPLMKMRYGSLLRVIHRFTRVRQNYGT